MQKLMLGFIMSFSFILTGCGPQTPLQKLESNERYDDMNAVFWGKEHRGNTSLWKQAVSYCKNYEEKPNCGAVMQVYIITNGSTGVSVYGTSGNTLIMPDFK